MNVGENRAQNGVTDCPESRNEENFQSIELLDSPRQKSCERTGRSPVKEQACRLCVARARGLSSWYQSHSLRDPSSLMTELKLKMGQNDKNASQG
ncbi:hypothetical protein E3N88_04514 [Mikania micrantha]|uniref:Uncharacterized protein n=1 Tax=Mikania micrantha TaxID=192012 RepID=A0A5N6PWH4_9ASTR|nr:hypothetical protein E3N88_04514 [Mikania micrantha]